MMIDIPLGPGEIFDRLTILTIKTERLSGDKQAQAKSELGILAELSAALIAEKRGNPELARRYDELKAVNDQLWVIEDDIRALDNRVHGVCDCKLADCMAMQDEIVRNEDYSTAVAKYVDLARAVYTTNDERSRLKSEINKSLGWKSEVKEYEQYDG